MKKKTLLFTLLAVLLLPAIAKAQNLTLVLHHADGKTSDVELYTMPRITMTADKMQIKSAVLDVEYDKADVLLFTFRDVDTGIQAVRSETAYRIDEDCVTFHGVPETGTVKVFLMNGVQVPVRLTRNGRDAVLSLAQLRQGVYLVSINGRTLKFVKP
jgi:hypothetical protein